MESLFVVKEHTPPRKMRRADPSEPEEESFLELKINRLRSLLNTFCRRIEGALPLEGILSSAYPEVKRRNFTHIDLITLIHNFFPHKANKEKILMALDELSKKETTWLIDFILALEQNPECSQFANLQHYLQTVNEERYLFLKAYLKTRFQLSDEVINCLRSKTPFSIHMIPNVMGAFGTLVGIEDFCLSEDLENQPSLALNLMVHLPSIRGREVARKIHQSWIETFGPIIAQELVERVHFESYCYGFLYFLKDHTPLNLYFKEITPFLLKATKENVLRDLSKRKKVISPTEFASVLLYHARTKEEFLPLLANLFDMSITNLKVIHLLHSLEKSPAPLKRREKVVPPAPYITAIGSKHAFEAISNALITNGKDPRHLILDVSEITTTEWIRDSSSFNPFTQTFTIPTPWLPNPLNYYMQDSRRTGFGFGLYPESILNMVVLCSKFHENFQFSETMVEGGNCIIFEIPFKSRFKKIAVIGESSLYLTHNLLKTTGTFTSFNRRDLSVIVTDKELQIARNLEQKRVISTPLSEDDQARYREAQIQYGNEEKATILLLARNLGVDTVIPIEHTDFHIDLRNFFFRGIFFTHSTEKTLTLLAPLLESRPDLKPYYQRALLKKESLAPLEAKNKTLLEAEGIKVVEIPGLLESPEADADVECKPPAMSFMNVIILSDNTLVTFDCPDKFLFLKEAYIAAIKEELSDSTLIFTDDPESCRELYTRSGGYRCKSQEIPFPIEA